MAEFKLGRLRFVWQGQWTTAHAYVKDDVVRYGGKSYTCMIGHTSDATDFYEDLNDQAVKWSLMTDGVEWKGSWTTATYYKIGDIVSNGSNSYITLIGHTSTTTDDAIIAGMLALFSGGIVIKGDYTINTTYHNLDVVRYNNTSYVCKVSSTTALPTTTSDWHTMSSQGIQGIPGIPGIQGIPGIDAAPYSLTAATTSALGGVIIQVVGTSGISNSSGTIGLATASTTQLGGVKVDGTSIMISSSGVITAASSLTALGALPTAGGVMTGDIVFASGQTVANLAFGSVGTIPYQSASGTTAMLAAGTSGNVLTCNGAAAPTWATASSGATKTISNKTGAYTVVAGDLGSIINCTSGTFTVSLTAAATLGSGFTCTIWNTGTGAITIDPAGAETIDGLATLILCAGEGMQVVCNGTNWETGNKKVMRGYVENINNTATRGIVTGANSIAIGNSAIAIGNSSFSAGTSSSALGNVSLAVGAFSTANSSYSTAIGSNSGLNGSVTAAGAGAMALGGSYASGTDSFAAGIANNTSTYGATGANSIAIGQLSKASGGAYGSTALGYNSTATGWGSVAIARGTASGDFSISIGYNSSATAAYSVAIGNASKSSQIGKYAFASNIFIANGDAQYGQIVLRAATTTTTAVVLTSDGGAAGTTNQLIVASDQAMTFFGTLIAKQTASANMASYMFKGAIVNNAGTVSISSISIETIVDTIGLTTQPTYTADNTNKALTVTSGAKSATNIRWVCNLDSVEVTYS